ncbi:DnaB-like helicase N-terminal domain-containing protein [Ekhidna sp.]|jgi:replicative DNA helicase|uniref:DnaB-like helicase N-terminal domain-containing protein n=1 Tax=Ekhidna sp. TaxID=2608089 RepID=UPI0032EE4B03
MELIDTIRLEQTIIGEMVLENRFFTVADFCTENNFIHHPHPAIFRACKALAESHKPIDLRTIRPHLSTPEFHHLLDCTQLVGYGANLPYHCMELVEKTIRLNVFTQSEKIIHKIPPKALKDFREFQENICLLHGNNDLFKVLEAGKSYFRIHAPAFADTLTTTLRQIDQKASIIKEKHGLQMIKDTLKHYENLTH